MKGISKKKFRKMLVDFALDVFLKEEIDEFVDEFVDKVYPEDESVKQEDKK